MNIDGTQMSKRRLMDQEGISLVIVGSTASGKSSLAMKIAQSKAAEIIAADSRTVYRGLSIGTAKPSSADMEAVPHHMVDVADWSQKYNVSDFQKQAKQAVRDVHARGHLPIIVGGSGLYVDSLIFDYDFSPPAETGVRSELEQKSTEELQQLVLDRGLNLPENARNRRYLVRVLEGASQHQRDRSNAVSGFLVIGLLPPRDVLEGRIRKRLTVMLEEGLLKEVEEAYRLYPAGSEPLKGNIYRSLLDYFEGKGDLDDGLEDFVRRDMRLAKKQATWFRRNKNITWFETPDQAYDYLLGQES